MISTKFMNFYKCLRSGAYRGYLKCSIRGTNNQSPIIFYKFAHLQLFNIKHKISHLQVVRRQIFFLRKSCLSQTEENCCLWTYGRASLVSDFNSSGKMRTCYLRDIYNFFEVLRPVQECTKMRLPDKWYRTNTVRTFWGNRSSSAFLSFEVPWLRPFR